MGLLTADYYEAFEHLPAGTSLVIHGLDWDGYERLLTSLADRPGLRTSFDNGRLEVMAPLPAHETFARFMDRVVYLWTPLRRTGSSRDLAVRRGPGLVPRR